jgi:hypothetical protein
MPDPDPSPRDGAGAPGPRDGAGVRGAWIAVLGGYGALGGAVVAELLRTTVLGIVIAGRNEQQARRVALALGERTRGAYADASDPRTLPDLLDGAALAISCASGLPRAVLERAVALRVPLIDLTPLPLERGARRALGERAWEARVPIVVHAGAVPGLAGVAAEFLVRRTGAPERLRIASSGPWHGTEGARADLAELERLQKSQEPLLARLRAAPGAEPFPPPIGRMRVRARRAPELEGFRELHGVGELSYVEADPGPLGRLLGRAPGEGFALRAVARARGGRECELLVTAPDVPSAAAALAAALARAALRRELPAGLCAAHEARNPGVLLGELRGAGLGVAVREPPAQ